MSEAQNRQRVNVSVFQAFGSERVEIRCGAESMRPTQLEALNLLRKLCRHFNVQMPVDTAAVRIVETQRIEAEMLSDYMQRDAAQEVPYSSPLTREIKWGVPA